MLVEVEVAHHTVAALALDPQGQVVLKAKAKAVLLEEIELLLRIRQSEDQVTEVPHVTDLGRSLALAGDQDRVQELEWRDHEVVALTLDFMVGGYLKIVKLNTSNRRTNKINPVSC